MCQEFCLAIQFYYIVLKGLYFKNLYMSDQGATTFSITVTKNATLNIRHSILSDIMPSATNKPILMTAVLPQLVLECRKVLPGRLNQGTCSVKSCFCHLLRIALMFSVIANRQSRRNPSHISSIFVALDLNKKIQPLLKNIETKGQLYLKGPFTLVKVSSVILLKPTSHHLDSISN